MIQQKLNEENLKVLESLEILERVIGSSANPVTRSFLIVLKQTIKSLRFEVEMYKAGASNTLMFPKQKSTHEEEK